MSDHDTVHPELTERATKHAEFLRAHAMTKSADLIDELRAALVVSEQQLAEARQIADGMARAPYGEFESMRGRMEAAEQQQKRLLAVIDKGRRFERAYQESLGATPTTLQWERLDSLQSAFLDAYMDALSPSTPEENNSETL